jgi:hypothetical protein
MKSFKSVSHILGLWISNEIDIPQRFWDGANLQLFSAEIKVISFGL